jgi:hypothetical protein
METLIKVIHPIEAVQCAHIIQPLKLVHDKAGSCSAVHGKPTNENSFHGKPTNENYFHG